MKEYYIFFSESFLEYPDNSSSATICSISGCKHDCKGCHSPNTQCFIQNNAIDFNNNGNLPISIDKWYKFNINNAEAIANILINLSTDDKKVVFTGGDCFYNIEIVKEVIKYLPLDRSICIYTGFKPEEAKEIWNNDYLERDLIFKCGGFKQNLYITPEKTDDYIQLASKNQCFCNKFFEQLSIDGRYYFNNVNNGETK